MATGKLHAVKTIDKGKWAQPAIRASMAMEIEIMVIVGDHPNLGEPLPSSSDSNR